MIIELNMRFCTCFVPGSALLKIGKGKNNFCDQNDCRYYIYIRVHTTKYRQSLAPPFVGRPLG